MSAIPSPNPRRQRTRSQHILRGELPRPTEPPAGCAFHTRCPLAIDVCRGIAPVLEEKAPGQLVACHLRP